MRPTVLLLLTVLVTITACSNESSVTASSAITGSRIWTGDADNPWAEAMAIDGDRILVVGSDEKIAAFIGDDTALIDGGGLVVPGGDHAAFLETPRPYFIATLVSFLIRGGA